MSKFIIQGGKELAGEVRISGSKNAALPIIAATVLVKGKITLYNVPNIQDVQTMFEIIRDIGGKVTKKNNKMIIDTSKINTYEIPENLMRKMRSSVILAGAIIGKYNKANFSYPGLRYLLDTSDKHKINEWIRKFKKNSILDFVWT